MAGPGGLARLGQDDFSAGAWPLQERMPANAVEDIVNGFVDEQDGISRRGGSMLHGAQVGVTGAPTWMWDGYLSGGRRVYLSKSGQTVRMLESTDTTWSDRFVSCHAGRPVALAGMLIAVSGTALVFIGSNLTAGASPTGTIAFTEGSNKVVGTGTDFVTSVPVGAILWGSGARRAMAVQAVNSNTELIVTAYPGVSSAGLAAPADYNILSSQSLSILDPANPTISPLLGMQGTTMVLGQAGNRLLVGFGSRIAFSQANGPSIFVSTDYHDMPGGAHVTGIEGVRDTALVFTTGGVYAIRNMAYDLTDEAGNPQQSLTLQYPDTILWGERGIASWGGAVIAPCIDGVYLLDAVGAPVGLATEPILALYRSYVAAGFTTGQATVWRSNYFLPIVAGDTWVDTLVCDLRRRCWSRWDGHGGEVFAFSRRVVDSPGEPLLLAAAAGNTALLDLSRTLTPSGVVKNDADGSTHELKVTTRLFSAGTLPVMWKKIRVRYELDDADNDDPTVTAEYQTTDRPGGSFAPLTGTAIESDLGDLTLFTWPINKRRRSIQVRFTSNNAAAKVVFRSFEVFHRPIGKA